MLNIGASKLGGQGGARPSPPPPSDPRQQGHALRT